MTNRDEQTLGEISILLQSHSHSFEEHKREVREAHSRLEHAHQKLEAKQEEMASVIHTNSNRLTSLETERSMAKWIVGLFAAGGTATGAAIAHLFGRGGGGQ